MRIAIRMDDITPDMDWERFFQVKAILDQYQVKPLIGVVPDNYDENLICRCTGKQQEQAPNSVKPTDYWQYIRELKQQGWIIAMHGYRHIYGTKKGGLFPLNDFSELAGLPYEIQHKMLADGKRILEEKGIFTDIFMAPAHAYDQNTLKVLREIGFTGITDGFGRQPYRWKGLTFYPISFQMSHSLKRKKGTTTLVLHAGTMNEQDRERIRGYFENHGSTEWISYGDYLEEETVKRGFLGHLKEYWLAKIKFLLVKWRTP